MKILPVCVLIAMCFIMKGSSETMRCYVCDNCNVLDDNTMLQSCPLDATISTTTPTPTTSIISTEPTNEYSSETSTSTPFENSGSTNDVVEKTTPTTVDPSDESSNNLQISPVDASEADSSMINIRPEQNSFPESSEPEMVSSYVPKPVLQTYQNKHPYQIVNRSLRSVLRAEPEPLSHHCYSINILDGDSRKVKKGCVEVPESKEACDVLKTELKESVIEKCRICSTDKCNSASVVKYSLITTVMMAIVISLH